MSLAQVENLRTCTYLLTWWFNLYSISVLIVTHSSYSKLSQTMFECNDNLTICYNEPLFCITNWNFATQALSLQRPAIYFNITKVLKFHSQKCRHKYHMPVGFSSRCRYITYVRFKSYIDFSRKIFTWLSRNGFLRCVIIEHS